MWKWRVRFWLSSLPTISRSDLLREDGVKRRRLVTRDSAAHAGIDHRERQTAAVEQRAGEGPSAEHDVGPPMEHVTESVLPNIIEAHIVPDIVVGISI